MKWVTVPWEEKGTEVKINILDVSEDFVIEMDTKYDEDIATEKEVAEFLEKFLIEAINNQLEEINIDKFINNLGE